MNGVEIVLARNGGGGKEVQRTIFYIAKDGKAITRATYQEICDDPHGFLVSICQASELSLVGPKS